MSEFRMSQFRPKSDNTQETLREFLHRADGAEDEREGFLMGRREINRDSRAAAKLGPLVIDKCGALSGRMVGLLPRSHTSH